MIQYENTVILSRAQLEQIIDRVAMKAVQEAIRQFSAKVSQQADLWDADQCAQFFGISKYTWANEWSHYKDAPPAAVMGDGPRAKRRWNSAEVIAYAEQRSNRK